MDAKGLFAVGKSYGVLRLDECGETVTVASIKGRTLRLTDGRAARILDGEAPDGSYEQVIRLNEEGACADVVRVCHAIATEPDCPHSWADGCDCFAPAAQDTGAAG